MQFIIKAYDGEEMLDKRMEVRPRHLEGMKDLDDYIANEPYVMEKVWEKIEVEPINVVIANGLKNNA